MSSDRLSGNPAPDEIEGGPTLCPDDIGTDDRFADLVLDSLARLENWVQENGWAGWDPFDLQGQDWYLALARKARTGSSSANLALRIITNAEVLFPRLTRKVCRVKPAVNAKAMGLFLQAYTNLYEASRNPFHLEQARECAGWLSENISTGYAGECWGYPFNWQSFETFIPLQTPSSVVSTVCGDGFWKLYQATGDQQYLDVCAGVCAFITRDLLRSFDDEDAICFSYTPADRFQVHNANLFAAEFLTRVGLETEQEALTETGIAASRFALREQNDDGSLYYWGREQNYRVPNHLDIYHSGFEIRSLYGLWKNTGREEFSSAYKRYLSFFTENYFTPKGHPKYSPVSVFPVDIHGCAEAIITLADTLPHHLNNLPLLKKTTLWLIDTMQTQAGWFIYRIVKKPYGIKRMKIPHLRWGQAWMLKALSEILCIG